MCCGTYVSVGPLLLDVGTDRLIATKWFCDSLLRYRTGGDVSTLRSQVLRVFGGPEYQSPEPPAWAARGFGFVISGCPAISSDTSLLQLHKHRPLLHRRARR